MEIFNTQLNAFGMMNMKNIHNYKQHELEKVRNLVDWYNNYRCEAVVGVYVVDGITQLCRVDKSGDISDFWVLFNTECNFDEKMVTIIIHSKNEMWSKNIEKKLVRLISYKGTHVSYTKHDDKGDVSYMVKINRHTTYFERVYKIVKSLG